METDVTKKEDGTVLLSGELPVETLSQYEPAALTHLGKELTLPGFRKGHVPPETLKKHLDEHLVLRETAERALASELPKLFIEHKVTPLGKPHVTITKIAPGNPLGFRVETSVLPEINLPDYKKIAGAVPEATDTIEVTDKDIDAAIQEIRTRVAAANQQQTTNDKQPQAPEHSSVRGGQEKKETQDSTDVSDLPELNDEFVKKLGGYTDVVDFKAKLSEQIRGHKTVQARERRRLTIIEDILKELSVMLPDILVEAELDKMAAQFRADVERVGMKFLDYLSQIKKDEGTLRAEWKPDATKRVKTQLILNEIARAENVIADKGDIEKEAAHILKHHPKANKDVVNIFVATQLTNEKVFGFLETVTDENA